MADNRPVDLRSDLASQLAYVRDRSPAYARLIELVVEQLDSGLEAALSRVWRDRVFGAFYERPLLLLNALREDALREGTGHPLFAGIGALEPAPESLTREKVRAALEPRRTELWATLAERYVQTNEPSRAVAWLWPAALAAGVAPKRPLALFDVGASAGLNLVADQLAATWERSDGAALEVAPIGPVAARRGFDLRPLNATDEADARWLRACVWPGQGDRLARLDDAIAAFRGLQARAGAPVVECAGAEQIPEMLPRGEDGALALAYQTIVRDYFPEKTRADYEQGMRAWLLARPPGTALWIELEVTTEVREGGPPAGIDVHVREGGQVRTCAIATCEPHPRVLEVNDAAVEQLLALLR